MTKFYAAILTMAMATAPAFAQAARSAMPNKSAQPQAGSSIEPSQLYDKGVSSIEKEWVSLAEAMPADKYDFAPTQGEFKGVRSFGDQAKHVAQANMMFFGSLLGQKPSPDEMKASSDVKGKDQIVAMLKKSYEMGHRAASSVNPQNAWQTVESPFGGPPISRAGLMTSAIAHGFDHYGQSVVYARMNGIVPPATAEAQKQQAQKK
jgi:uncharacterized damage-inducible protein DinB